jgi:tripartite-type tricarboxylate transporter receptor subunit TctC
VFASSTALIEVREAGVKALAIGTETRMKQLPDVPTFAEAGLKFYPRIDRGICAPRGMPQDIAAKLEKTLLDIFRNKEYQKKITEAGFVPNPLGSDGLQKYIDSQTAALKKIVDEEGLMKEKVK